MTETDATPKSFGLALDGEGQARWTHIQMTEPDAAARLESLVVDPMVRDALLADETRPRWARFPHGTLMILRGVNLNPGAEPEDTISLRVWLTESGVVSTGLRRLHTVDDIRRQIEEGRLSVTPPELLLKLIAGLTVRTKDIVRTTEAELESEEDRILGGEHAGVGTTLKELRRRAIALRRFAEPQLEALEDMLRDPPDWLDAPRALLLRELADATERNLEALTATRDHVAAVQDQLGLALAERSNRTNQVLTVVATVFLPLNLVAALLVANVGGVPGADTAAGFWIMTAGTLLVLVLGLALLLRSRWFR